MSNPETSTAKRTVRTEGLEGSNSWDWERLQIPEEVWHADADELIMAGYEDVERRFIPRDWRTKKRVRKGTE